jgi:hypothetical protein
VLTANSFNRNDVDIVNITALSKEEYVFVIYIKSLKIRYTIRGAYNTKTQTVTIKKMDEVFHPKLQEMKEPEMPQTKILEKGAISSNSEAKEVFDYLYKVRPSFRQTQVDAVKIETGSEIKTVTIMQTKDGKSYRSVILKDQKTNELQLVDESVVVNEVPKTTVIEQNNDGTSSVITNKVDYSSKETKTIISTLKHNNIDTTTTTISSLQTIDGPKSIQYTVVLEDSSGNPSKQVTIIQSKDTQETTVTDVLNIEDKINYIAPVTDAPITIPPTQFYKQEIKDLVNLIQHNSDQSISIAKIKNIVVINTTLASMYELTVENSKGEEVTINAVQDKSDQSVEVISIKPVAAVVETVQAVQTTNTKVVNSYGVSIEYTNDKTVLTTDQNINIALTSINSQLPQYQSFQVVSSLTKTFTQNQVQTLILTNQVDTVQITGNIDIKTLRYVPIEVKEVPLNIEYPIIQQGTIPAIVYPAFIKEHKEVKDSESILIEKYKMFKGKIPTTTTVEQYFDVMKTTFTYEISTKKFVAVVDYNITSKTGKIIEMSPVQDNVVAVSVETQEINGQTITTSNNIQEIKSTNSNTDAVLTTIATQYPLLKKSNITEVKVIESTLSDTFEVTYTDFKTNISTVITTNSDKQGQNITI